METKKCSRCRSLMPTYQFDLNRVGKPFKTCNPCRIQMQTYKKSHAKEIKQWRFDHKVESKAYQDGRKEIRSKIGKEYRRTHQAEIVQWRKDNPDYAKAYKKINWDRCLIHSSKKSDRKYNRFHNVTKEFLRCILAHQDGQCFHCLKVMKLTNGNKDPDQVSIERIDNTIGHVKSNTVLCCLNCNYDRNVTLIEIYTPNPTFTVLSNPDA